MSGVKVKFSLDKINSLQSKVNTRWMVCLSIGFVLLACSSVIAVGSAPAISDRSASGSVQEIIPSASSETSGANSFETTIDPVVLNKEIFEGPGHIKFESGEWKNSVDKRRHMLVDFSQMNLLDKSSEEIHTLLGQPFKSETNQTVREFYDLGDFKKRKICLAVKFLENRLYSLSLGQKLLPGFPYFYAADWHWTNPQNSEIAKVLNQHYYLVGAPVEHLCQLMARPEKIGDHWSCGPFQLDYTPDETKVLRFRLCADNSEIFQTTDWQDADVRVNKGSYSTASDLQSLEGHVDSCLTKPLMRFDFERWKVNWARDSMLFDLTHNHDLVGSSRERIQKLLGAPTFNENSLVDGVRKEYFARRIKETEPMNKFDWYRLDSPGCIGAEPLLNFELVYENGKVAGYRTIEAMFFPLKNDGDYWMSEQCDEREGRSVPALHR